MAKKLNVAELDFDLIKQNFKNFLKSNTEFDAYDLEGSAINTLLDILAYNTHYNAFYANMLANESFLDTAVKRSSVVSHAAKLGYVPNSSNASTAIVDIQLRNVPRGTPLQVINRGTVFNASVTNQTFTFICVENTISDSNYRFKDVVLKEGRLIKNTFKVDNLKNPRQVFEIPNKDIDVSTLKVFVRDVNTTSEIQEFKPIFDGYNLNKDSKVFFVDENFKENYQIYFGDGVLGKRLEDQSIITVSYIISKKQAADGCKLFSLDSSINGFTDFTITTKQVSAGGAEKEEIDSIKYNAPRLYTSQNRNVTRPDYESRIRSRVPNLESVVVFGGEDARPPRYGKVLVSLKPKDGFFYSDSQKEQIRQSLIKDNIVTITPEFIDPDFTYVSVSSIVTYNPDLTSRSQNQIDSLVRQQINDYIKSTVNKFNSPLIYSDFLANIDETDPSIIGNLTELTLSKRISNLNLNSPNSFTSTFGVSVQSGSLKSNFFQTALFGAIETVSVFDKPSESFKKSGRIYAPIYARSTQNNREDVIGSIEYATGEFTITAFIASYGIEETNLIFYANPISKDIYPSVNQIITVDDNLANATSNRQLGVDVIVRPVQAVK